MSYPRSHQQILDVIENDLRESDPKLVSAFAALVTNTTRPLGPRRERIRLSARLRYRWRAGRSGARFPLIPLVPVIVFAVLSVLILTIPGPHPRRCGPVNATARVLPHGIAGCLPGAGDRDRVQHPAQSRAHV